MSGVNPSSSIAIGVNHDCVGCGNADLLDFPFSYAYQPIVDIDTRQIYAHEALVRGPAGEPARTVLDRVNEANRFRFDQACRVKAIGIAARLQMKSMLSINFLPNAIYRPEVCIQTTLEAARAHDFPVDKIIFETTEGERIADGKRLAEIFREYQRVGFLTAIDDFGAGFAGLNLLADFQPEIIKIDMELVRHIDKSRPRQAIVRGIARICEELKILIIGEGVESLEEGLFLQSVGIHLIQGYLFSKPRFESICSADDLVWPDALMARSGQPVSLTD